MPGSKVVGLVTSGKDSAFTGNDKVFFVGFVSIFARLEQPPCFEPRTVRKN
jgi:hypothetical protein